MNKLLNVFLLMIVAISIKAQNYNYQQLIKESISKYNFTQTVDTLSKIAEQKKWKVVIIHDLQQSLSKSGKEILPVKVIEVCNPNFSFNVLNKDQFKLFSSLMPCRISIYEKTDGKTFVARINPEMMSTILKELQCKSMTNALEDIEKFINEVEK